MAKVPAYKTLVIARPSDEQKTLHGYFVNVNNERVGGFGEASISGNYQFDGNYARIIAKCVPCKYWVSVADALNIEIGLVLSELSDFWHHGTDKNEDTFEHRSYLRTIAEFNESVAEKKQQRLEVNLL